MKLPIKYPSTLHTLAGIAPCEQTVNTKQIANRPWEGTCQMCQKVYWIRISDSTCTVDVSSLTTKPYSVVIDSLVNRLIDFFGYHASVTYMMRETLKCPLPLKGIIYLLHSPDNIHRPYVNIIYSTDLITSWCGNMVFIQRPVFLIRTQLSSIQTRI